MTATPDLYFADLTERNIQYNARASVADFDACVREYTELSAAARRQCAHVVDQYYGFGAAERLDLFLPPGGPKPAPVMVFIHGGYWRGQSKEDSSLMAPAFNAAGVAVAVVEYTLMPEATLAEIVREVRSAIAWVFHNAPRYGLDAGRIHVSGSSAGGHLAGAVATSGWQEKFGVPADVVKGAVALSGLYDLQPLCDIDPNAWVRLHSEQSRLLSPLFMPPPAHGKMILSVGGLETQGFKNQTAAYEGMLRAAGVDVDHIAAPRCNHFNLLCELAKADSPLTQATLAMIGA